MKSLVISAICTMLAMVAFTIEEAGAEVRIMDATGETVHVRQTDRVVSVGGAVTEIVFGLGLSDRIVAVDSTSRYPDETATKPKVGYMRQLGAEPILALNPSLVLAVEDAGPPEALDQIREAGVPVILVPDKSSPEGVIEKIALVAETLGAPEKGRAFVSRFRTEIQEASTLVASVISRPRVLFLLTVGSGGAPLAAGLNTSAAGIIELAGGINVVDAFEGYRPLSPEAAVAAAPEVILMTEQSLSALGGGEGLRGIPEIALTPAGQQGRVVAMDGLLLLGFGPRTAVAITQLARGIHPELSGE